MDTKQSDVCPICRKPMQERGGPFTKGNRSTICWACQKEVVDPKAAARCKKRHEESVTIDSIKEKKWSEMRQAMTERDRFRNERDRIKEEIRAEATSEEADKLRKMPFWTKVKFLFNPWGI